MTAALPLAAAEVTHQRMWAEERAVGQIGSTWTGEYLPLWVREGGKKTPITVAKEMNKGDKTHFIKLDGKRHVTGFRVSDGGQGRYRISVK